MKRWKFAFVIIYLNLSVYFLNGCVTTAMQFTSQPTQQQLESFRSLKTVLIVVDQFYSGAEDVSFPFKDVTQRLLEYAGLKVAKASDNYDGIIKIHVRGKGIGAYYTDGKYRYTGASVSGTVSFEVPGITLYKKSFNGYKKNSFWIDPSIEFTLPSTPSSSPLGVGFSVFVPKIVKIVEEVFGLQPLTIALKDKNSSLRLNAEGVLDEINPNWRNSEITKQAVFNFTFDLKDKNYHIRRGALDALGTVGDFRSVVALGIALKDENSNIRENAAFYLGETGNPLAVEPLISALKDEDALVRAKSAEALGRIKDSRAIEPLIAVVNNDTTSFVQSLAVRALKKITGKDFGKNPEKHQKW